MRRNLKDLKDWGFGFRFGLVVVWRFPASAGIPRLPSAARPLTSSTKGACWRRSSPLWIPAFAGMTWLDGGGLGLH